MKATQRAAHAWAKPRDNKPWTGQDLRRTRKYAASGMSARQAAAKLGRSAGGVKYKAMIEGIRFHAIEQPRGTQRTRKQRQLLSRITARRHRERRRAA